jgi:hypothetical protein
LVDDQLKMQLTLALDLPLFFVFALPWAQQQTQATDGPLIDPTQTHGRRR